MGGKYFRPCTITKMWGYHNHGGSNLHFLFIYIFIFVDVYALFTYTLTNGQDCCLEVNRGRGEEMVIGIRVHEKGHPFSCYVDSEYITKLQGVNGRRGIEGEGTPSSLLSNKTAMNIINDPINMAENRGRWS